MFLPRFCVTDLQDIKTKPCVYLVNCAKKRKTEPEQNTIFFQKSGSDNHTEMSAHVRAVHRAHTHWRTVQNQLITTFLTVRHSIAPWSSCCGIIYKKWSKKTLLCSRSCVLKMGYLFVKLVSFITSNVLKPTLCVECGPNTISGTHLSNCAPLPILVIQPVGTDSGKLTYLQAGNNSRPPTGQLCPVRPTALCYSTCRSSHRVQTGSSCSV